MMHDILEIKCLNQNNNHKSVTAKSKAILIHGISKSKQSYDLPKKMIQMLQPNIRVRIYIRCGKRMRCEWDALYGGNSKGQISLAESKRFRNRGIYSQH